MKAFIALVRREVWEHGAIWMVPAIMSALLVLVSIVASGSLLDEANDFHIVFGGAEMDRLPVGLTTFSMATVGMFSMVMSLVGIFYLLDCLLADRKDRSILFWKSLPVSDLTTVLSKLVTAALVIPTVAVAAGLVTSVLLLVVMSVDLMILGESPWELLWSQYPLFSTALLAIYGMSVQVLWYLPLVGYLMMVSAFARRAVLAWAVLPPVVLILLEKQLFGSHLFADLVGERFAGVLPLAFDLEMAEQMADALGHNGHQVTVSGLQLINPAPLLQSAGLWLGLLVAAGFIAAAVYLRRFRDESL